MEEIKFRGFHKPSKTWLTHEASLSIIMLQGRVIDKIADDKGLLNRHEIMQYTGLKDKNGKEIYTGDIIQATLKEDHRVPTMGVIVFDYEHSCYANKNQGGITPLFSMDGIKIIGNKFQNPDLYAEIIK